jgi:hypothetical protein
MAGALAFALLGLLALTKLQARWLSRRR